MIGMEVMRTGEPVPEIISVADAKKRFSELVDRVKRGERFVVIRRGRPVVVLVPPDEVGEGSDGAPIGLVSIVGALADWPKLDEVVAEICASRRRARDRVGPNLGWSKHHVR
jgi:prevent-host-death family protein